ncbi:hypothetical protein [Enterococcus faecalis]|uniref:hypothetical protein n=1 Tax=Enterococcus faecalis TaxID=1351 RepID=UPI003CC6BBC9
MIKKIFRYRGKRIRYSSRNLLALYRVFFFMPIFACLSYFVGYKWMYPLYFSNPSDWKVYTLPVLIIVGFSVGSIVIITLFVKVSIINSGYFSKVEQRQVLARMIIDNSGKKISCVPVSVVEEILGIEVNKGGKDIKCL